VYRRGRVFYVITSTEVNDGLVADPPPFDKKSRNKVTTIQGTKRDYLDSKVGGGCQYERKESQLLRSPDFRVPKRRKPYQKKCSRRQGARSWGRIVDWTGDM